MSWTLKRKFALFTVFLVLATVTATLAIAYSYFRSTLLEAYRSSADQYVASVAEDLDAYFADIDRMTLAFHYTADISNFFNRRYPLADEKEADRQAQVYIKALLDMKAGIEGISLIRDDQKLISSSFTGGRLVQVIDTAAVGRQTGVKDWESILGDRSYRIVVPWKENAEGNVVIFARWFMNLNIAGKHLGVILIHVKAKVLDAILSGRAQYPAGEFFIVGEGGRVLQSADGSKIGKGIADLGLTDTRHPAAGPGPGYRFDEGKYLVASHESRVTGWLVVRLLPWTTLLRNLGRMRDNILLTGALLILASSMAAYFFSFRITNPLKMLGEQLAKFGEGVFREVPKGRGGGPEIDRLIDTFNTLVGEKKDLVVQVHEEQRQKRAAELKALLSQINPHFLNNTLSSLVWMVSSDRKKESMEMITSLSSLLRTSFGDNREMIPIECELEHLGSYVEIQRIRYRSKLAVRFDIDDALYGHLMPRFLLQPLVENSITHGISRRKSGGVIRIIGKRDGEAVVFKVFDNGCGMDDATLSRIQDAGNKGEGGYGVYNVNKRAKLHFGDGFGLAYLSKPGKGTLVSLRLPLIVPGNGGHV